MDRRDFPMVIRGGRVIDPGPGLDMFVDLAIKDTRAAAIGPGRAIVDECEDAV
jgi:predicted amidohydrolase